MVFAVESLFPDHPEDLPPTDFNVGDVFESFETEDIDEALAIHAALTEWKAKREKPVEPKWRAWKASETPIGKLLRFKDEEEKRWLIVGTNGAAVFYGTYMGLSFELALERCEWSADDGDWFPCGVLAE